MTSAATPPRVLISYAHDSVQHEDLVRQFWQFLRANGVDARLDLPAAEQRQDWTLWMTREVSAAQFVLVIASPAYRQRSEGEAPPAEGRGVQWEAAHLRELINRDREAGLRKILPVVLPGRSSDDIPIWLSPTAGSHYTVDSFSVAGAERLLRTLLGQPYEVEPPIGPQPDLPPREQQGHAFVKQPAVATEIEVDISIDQGELVTNLTVAGTAMPSRRSRLPQAAVGLWSSLSRDAAQAERSLVSIGRQLAEALFDPELNRSLSGLVTSLPPGEIVHFRFTGNAASQLPVELIRLGTEGDPVEPLGLAPGVSICRQPWDRSGVSGLALAGPLKVLVAVAAPDETKTASSPLDVEAEMQAVLDATSSVADDALAEVRILEVGSLAEITRALAEDEYHVLHLSAHGGSAGIELADEDGYPEIVTAADLMNALRQAGHPVPLILLSACGEQQDEQDGMALQLLRGGADRIIAMQTKVSDPYATDLAAAFYRALSGNPSRPVGYALNVARYEVERERRHRSQTAQPGDKTVERPEYGVATLWAAGADKPLIAEDQLPHSLRQRTVPSQSVSVQDLPIGRLIGRRPQLREATAIARRTTWAVDQYGYTAGVMLTGVGGIGKTAVAGRVKARLREAGWRIAVHVGAWNPTSLVSQVAAAIENLPQLATIRDRLLDPHLEDASKLELVQGILGSQRLLIVFDDFEQNLAVGGGWRDASVRELFGRLADAARAGSLLVTSRYPLAGFDGRLAEISLPPLSPAELGRLLRRMPALRELQGENRTAVIRTVGGHPRLIEFLDALLRGRGRTNLPDTSAKLRQLAQENHLDLTKPRQLGQALDDAILLGCADILLEALVAKLTISERQLLRQLAVCRASATSDDLAYALHVPAEPPEGWAPDRVQVQQIERDAERLADLTLVSELPARNESVYWVLHPWTAAAMLRIDAKGLSALHEGAEQSHLRRLRSGHGRLEDLLDLGVHLAALERHQELVGLADAGQRLIKGRMAVAAFLAELRALIPTHERAATLVGELELRAVLDAGDVDAGEALALALWEQTVRRAEADPSNSEWQRDLSVTYNKLGDLHRTTGDLTAARQHYTDSLTIRQRLAESAPSNAQWQRDLSVSHNRLGDIEVATGDLAAARQHYTDGLTIAQRLAESAPSNTEWQRDLSVSHDKLGDLAIATGNLAAARQHHTDSLTIAQRLAESDPSNTEWQRDLSVSHNKLADIEVATGNLAAARQHFTDSLTIRRRLAATDPSNTQWQRDMSVSHERLGDLAIATGDLATARQHHTDSLTIRRRLADTDPSNTEWQRDLSVSHNKLADLAITTNDLATARQHHTDGLTIAQRLARTDPSNTQWRRDLSVSHNKLGDIEVAAGDLAAARQHYTDGLTIAQRLAESAPSNTQWQRDLSVSHDKLGDLAIATGNLAAARQHHTDSLTIAQRLAESDPSNTEWQRDLSVSHNKLADIEVATGNLAAARQHFTDSLTIRRRLAATDPSNAHWQRDLAYVQQKLADLDKPPTE